LFYNVRVLSRAPPVSAPALIYSEKSYSSFTFFCFIFYEQLAFLLIKRYIIFMFVVSSLFLKLLPTQTAYAHCDLPCGVYDPAQARIEAESVMKIMEKYSGFHEDEQKWRAIFIKEERAELVKHHLWVLWTDYFKPEHLEKFPNLHDLFWRATKAAGQAKKSVDPADGQKLLDLIAEITEIFNKTKQVK